MEIPCNPSAAQDCYSPPTPHKLLGTSRVFMVLWNVEKVRWSRSDRGTQDAASRAMNAGKEQETAVTKATALMTRGGRPFRKPVEVLKEACQSTTMEVETVSLVY